MDALHDVEASCSPQDARTVNLRTNCTEVHSHSDQGDVIRAHFTRNAGWLRLYDYRDGDRNGVMFHANGQGSVEWITGWGVTIPPSYFIMLMPYTPIPNLEIIVGILNAKNLNRPGKTGLSIGVRPHGPVTLVRGQPIARMILLHPDSVHATASFEESATSPLESASENQAPGVSTSPAG